jgi:hypothetical protein
MQTMMMALFSGKHLVKYLLGRLKRSQQNIIKMDPKDHEDLRIMFSIRYT